MLLQKCIAAGAEEGDCYRACVASIMRKAIAEVPNFAVGNTWESMEASVRAWLSEHGAGLFRTYCSAKWELEKLLEVFSASNPGIPIIVSGRSPYSAFDNHAVIALDGRIVHDPARGGDSGLIGPCVCDCGVKDCDKGWWWLDVITAQGIEAQRAVTGNTDAVTCDESPVCEADAPNPQGTNHAE